MATGSVLFSETQRFRQWWILALLGLAAMGSVAAFVWQVLLGNELGNNPGPDILVIVVFLVFGLGLPAFILSVKLQTEVRRDAVSVRLWPLHRSWVRIPTSVIKEAFAVTYSPIREYGGWGLRFGPNGRAYNVSGNRGVQLVYEESRRLLIGSRRPEELEGAIAAARGVRS